MRGRKPKPTELHELHGTTNVTRHAGRADEPIAFGELAGDPAPDWMTDDQQDAWTYVMANAPKGLLKRIDRGMLAVWVEAECRHRMATMQQAIMDVDNRLPMLAKGKDGIPVVSPYIGIINKAALVMVKAASELGFSPASRPRLAGQQAGGEVAASSPWARLRVIPGGAA